MIDARSPFTVHVAKHGTAVANAMNEIRRWPDNSRLQPGNLAWMALIVGGILFASLRIEIAFCISGGVLFGAILMFCLANLLQNIERREWW
jgi:hypothetical protein